MKKLSSYFNTIKCDIFLCMFLFLVRELSIWLQVVVALFLLYMLFNLWLRLALHKLFVITP